MGPVTDRASRLLRWLARHGDDLDDLLGAEGGRPAGARGIIEDSGDQAEDLGVGEVVLLGLGQSLSRKDGLLLLLRLHANALNNLLRLPWLLPT